MIKERAGDIVLVYNTDICIAYKNRLELYTFDHISIFNLSDIPKDFPVESFKRQGKNIRIVIKCSMCDETHIFQYQINDLIRSEMIIGGCELLNKPIFVFGKPLKVVGFVNRYNEVNREVYAML